MVNRLPGYRRLDDRAVGTSAAVGTAPAPSGSRRVDSVDALRGFDMFLIIGGDGVAWSLRDMSEGHGPILGAIGQAIGGQFEHAAWEGMRFYDLIFPLFIFLVGVAIVFSLPQSVGRIGKSATYFRILRRSFVLFLLGFLYYGGVSHRWPDVRLLGVLQHIAISFLFTSILFLNLRLRGLVVAFVLLVGGYWAAMNFVPVPGVGAGSFAQDANLAGWLDQQLLPGKKGVGEFEPEGLLSALPAIGTCLLGVFAGMLLRNPQVTPQRKTLWLIGGGLVLVAAGWLWGLQFPVIKALWTSSYVLLTGGLSAILLGLFYQVVDVWGYRAWSTIFVWIGANAIALYLINELVRFRRLAQRLVGGDVADFFDAHVTAGTGHLLENLVGLAIAIALAGYLYRRRIFIRV